MKVYCRFAPPPTEGGGSTHRPVHLLVDDVPPSERSSSTAASLQSLTVGDPITGSCASLTCHAVFLPHAADNNQHHVFQTVALPMIEDVLAGRSSALLAYGQTCTGKTHTMFGPDGGNVRYFHSVDARGVVPRVAEALFVRRASCRVVAVDVRYFELYNETATDLVAKLVMANRENADPPLAASLHAYACGHTKPQPLQVTYKPTEKQRLKRSLSYVAVTNGDDCLQVIGELSALRQVSSTDSNMKSTRSHVVIQLHVHVATDGGRGMGEQMHSGQLTLIDLAGSESLKAHHASLATSDVLRRPVKSQSSSFEDPVGILRSQHMQLRQHEMKHINTSLFALKKVVHALTTKQEHVPVNESMLTVVLEGPLQSSSAALVVCCSTQHKDLQETLATMRLGSEAAQIPPVSTVASRMRVHTHHQQHAQQQQLERRLLVGQQRTESSDDDEVDGSSNTSMRIGAAHPAVVAVHAQKTQPRQEAFHMEDVPLPEITAPFGGGAAIAIRTVGELFRAGVVGSVAGEDDASWLGDGSHGRSSSRGSSSRNTTPSAATTRGDAASVDEERLELRTLRHQCARMAEAYDEAMEEVARLRRALREKTEAVHRLELEVSIVKNNKRLATQQQPARFQVLCEHIEPERASADQDETQRREQGPARTPSSFGADITNIVGHCNSAPELAAAPNTRCGEGATDGELLLQRRTRRPTVQIFTPSSERHMLQGGAPQEGSTDKETLPVTPMLRV